MMLQHQRPNNTFINGNSLTIPKLKMQPLSGFQLSIESNQAWFWFYYGLKLAEWCNC